LNSADSVLSGVHQFDPPISINLRTSASNVKNIAVISISALATLASLWLMVSFAQS
jgi:hypothetical protein